MRNFCECIYGSVSQLIQMGKFSLMSRVSNGIVPSEGRHLTLVSLPYWPERQTLSGCVLPLGTTMGQGSESRLPKLKVAPASSRQSSVQLTAWLHFWSWAENLAKPFLTPSQYFEIINVLFQDIKLKVLCYAQAENEYNLFSLRKFRLFLLPVFITFLPCAKHCSRHLGYITDPKCIHSKLV